MSFKTADLCDAHPAVAVCESLFTSYGGRRLFAGRIATVRCHEDNSLVRETLQTAGHGRVLVVDGGGSRNCALVGDLLGAAAVSNGWAGVIVFGCVRDTAELATMDLGVLALATHPRRSERRGLGERDVEVRFGGVKFAPGSCVYVDEDGVIVSPVALVEE
jgi:regulator of ribonuclease activity A